MTETIWPDKLHWISLSDGRKFDGGSIRSEFDPIILPVAGQSFEDIDMVVPKNADSIELSSLIGEPYNYWGDDDGDGQGIDGITATGSIKLSIVDRKGQPVARNEVLDICKAPYILTLSNTDITLKTRYGIPNERFIYDYLIIYYINPKVESQQQICVAKPNMRFGKATQPNYEHYVGPASMWNPNMGFLTQSFTPSSYDLNFPTTGANNLSFDLEIGGVRTILYGGIEWEVITSGDIKATITRSSNSSTSITVTLTGPAITDNSQNDTNNPSPIGIPSLPQAFEIVGKIKEYGKETGVVVKYGFVLKQWFVNRQKHFYNYRDTSTWCTKVGYRMPTVKDLTNATCQGWNLGNPYYCEGSVGATPSSASNNYTRHIGAGFFSEWGMMQDYPHGNFHGPDYESSFYWTSDISPHPYRIFMVNSNTGSVSLDGVEERAVCVYP